jgi:outer membrane lipase/esterase
MDLQGVIMRTRIFAVIISLLLGFSGGSAFAYSNIVAFGDSYTDNGIVGSWTNGNVWVEYLSSDLSASLENRALGGAETIGTNGLNWQVANYISGLDGSNPAPGTLFTLFIGGNDHLHNSRGAVDAAENAAASLQALITAGATDILVLNLPNLGVLPVFNDSSAGEEDAAESFSINYNAELEANVNKLAAANSMVNFFMVNVFSLVEDVIDSPATYGLTNVDDAATGGNYEGYLFYDDVHITTAAHREIADLAGESLSAVPIPGAVWLLGSGIIGLFGMRHKMYN